MKAEPHYLDPGTISLASLRLSRADDSDPGIVPAEPKSTTPIRILVTRRTGRELVRDVQSLLNRMSFDADDEDGLMGAETSAAIQRFQESEGLVRSGAMSAELVADLYEAAGKGQPLLGHIYVRQDFKDILDAPIRIKDPELALGTHFFTAHEFNSDAENTSWTVMSLQDTPRTTRLSFMPSLQADRDAMQPRTALDRLEIPTDIRTRISALLTPGSSLSITDNGISRETGKGTDFIVLTR